MSVEDWARREAQRRYKGLPEDQWLADTSFTEGAIALGYALLSDEAVEAAENAYWEVNVNVPGAQGGMRAALQAAVDAVTEGESE